MEGFETIPREHLYNLALVSRSDDEAESSKNSPSCWRVPIRELTRTDLKERYVDDFINFLSWVLTSPKSTSML